MNKAPIDLAYFTEWGGRNWKKLIELAINELRKNDGLNGADLLDIGTRYGKMAVLFALMGAKVIGIDVQECSLRIAREEAKKWNVSNLKFIRYSGDLDIFPDESFDIVFTKSVLVVVPNLESFLRKISKKLKPSGRVIFLENGKGNFLFYVLRTIRHQKWDWHRANYFTNNEVRLIQSMFQIDILRRTFLPPVYLFLGRKRV